MAETVCDIRNQLKTVSFRIFQDSIDSLYHDLDQVYILPLVETSDIIGLGYLSLMENHINRTGMVLDIQPVAHILALAIYRKRLTITYVIDEQRDKLLRELIWTVVVRAIRNNCRHAVSVMICSYKMVRTCLAGTIWTMRVILCSLIEEIIAIGLVAFRRCNCLEMRFDTLRMVHCQRSINLVCRDMVKAFTFITV